MCRIYKKGIVVFGTVLIILAWCLFLLQVEKNKKELVAGLGIFTHSDFGPCYLTSLCVHDYPFVIAIGIGRDEFLSDFNQYRNRLLWVLIMLTSLGLSGVVLLFKMINRNQAYLDALTISNKENKRLIQRLEKEHRASTRAASFDPLTELYIVVRQVNGGKDPVWCSYIFPA